MGLSRLWARSLALVATAVGLAACGSEEAQPVPEAAGIEVADEPDAAAIYPMVIQDACPGEGCMYGEWVACAEVVLFADPREGSTVVGMLELGRRFEVATGVVVIDSPTVVLVTEATQQSRSRPNSLTFQPGDTIEVLDYRGEGFFNVLYGDTIVSTSVFWEWINTGPQDIHTGTVLAEGAAAFWVATTGEESDRWINVNASRVASPSTLSPDPAVCR